MKKNTWKALVLSVNIFLAGCNKSVSNINTQNKNDNKEPIKVVSIENNSEINLLPTNQPSNTSDEIIISEAQDTNVDEVTPIEETIDEETLPIAEETYSSEQEDKITLIANEVIDGFWGEEEERRNLLELNGYDYYEVMNKVNEILGCDFRYEKPIISQEPQSNTHFYNLFGFINTTTYLFDEYDNDIYELEKYEKITFNNTFNNNKIGVSLPNGQSGFVIGEYITELPGTYVEVDISEQKVYMYIDNDLVFTANVITGNPYLGSIPGTDLGYTEIYEKQYQTYLIGPTWKNYVDIFMRFNDSEEGFHDADGWRSDSEYGDNTLYLTNGSHGCVNMMQEDAEMLDKVAPVGTKVLVHK